MAGFMLMLLLFSMCFMVDSRGLCGSFHADTITVFCVVGLNAGGCVAGFMLILLLFYVCFRVDCRGCVAGFMLILLLFSMCFRVDCRWLCWWFHADTITVFYVF